MSRRTPIVDSPDAPIPMDRYKRERTRLRETLREPWWERQPNEPSKSFETFLVYRDIGVGRTVQAVATHFGVSHDLISKRAALWRWHPRAQAYDLYIDQKAQEVVIDERLEAARRHAQIARIAQGKVLEKLRILQPEELSPADASRWLDIAVRIERQSLGESTEKVEIETGHVEPFLVRFLDQIVMPLVKSPDDAAFVRARMAELLGSPLALPSPEPIEAD